MNWSRYQQAIFSAFEQSEDSLLIEAVAGSGKSTTLLELARIMERAFPRQTAAFVAFNKAIAENLAQKITAPNVRAMTLHSAGFAAWRRAGGIDWCPKVDSGKVSGVMREVMTWEESRRWGETTRKLVALAKQVGLVPAIPASYVANSVSYLEGLVPDTQEQWESLMDHYSVDPEECDLDLVRRVLARSIELSREVVDFDDMLYMPVVAGVPFDRYDVVLVDEAQDLSGIQHEIISRMVGYETNGTGEVNTESRQTGWQESARQVPARDMRSALQAAIADSGSHAGRYHSRSRVIAVGDRHQAIYGFRGAHADSMDRLRERFGMRELPLSVSYRCPQAVVVHAQQWVPQIEYTDWAEFGYVGEEGTDWAGQCEIALEGISKWRRLEDFRPGDAVLCRLTRPLIEAAFTLIRGRVACRVLGRDIGKGLVTLVLKVARKRAEMPLGEFWDALDEYQTRQCAKWNAKGEYARAGQLGDQCDTLRVWQEDLGPEDTVATLTREVERLFTDGNGGLAGMVTLSTIHKFKGLEAERVFVLDAGETLPCKWARQSWELQAEANLAYVACTRAMRELRYITTEDLKRRAKEEVCK